MRKFVVVSMAVLFALFISIPMASAQLGSIIGTIPIVIPDIPMDPPFNAPPYTGVMAERMRIKDISRRPLFLAETMDLDSDGDGDGVSDAFDNCPDVPNPVEEVWPADGWGPPELKQLDSDDDGIGDACEVEGVIGEAWQDLDGDGVDDFNEDNCVGYKNEDQADGDGDGVGDACDVCLDDPNPDHQELDDCVGEEEEVEVAEEVIEEDNFDIESGEMNYFDLSEEEFGDAMEANAAAGAGCTLAQATPAINALGIFLIGIGLLQIISRKRK